MLKYLIIFSLFSLSLNKKKKNCIKYRMLITNTFKNICSFLISKKKNFVKKKFPYDFHMQKTAYDLIDFNSDWSMLES